MPSRNSLKNLWQGKEHFRHSFAKWLLSNRGVKIFQNGKQILTSENISSIPAYFKEYVLKPKIEVGDFKKSVDIIDIRSMDQLKKIGILIKSFPMGGKFQKRSSFRSVIYHPSKAKDDDERDGGVIIKNPLSIRKAGNQILYDRTNQAVCIKGANGSGEWVVLNETKERELRYDELDKYSKLKSIQGWGKNESKKWMLEIKEIPLGISSTGKLVCLPHLRDTPRIGFVGPPGTGKSIFLHSLLCIFYWYGKKWCHLNDWKYETYKWALPCPEQSFETEINKFGLTPAPLPCVWVYPKTSNQPKRTLGSEENLTLFISMNWHRFLDRYNEITEGMKEMEMGKSLREFDKLIPYLKKCKNLKEDIEDLLELNKYGLLIRDPNMKSKIMEILRFLNSKQVLDISNKIKDNIVIQTDYETVEMPTIPGLMYAGLCPIFVPRDLEGVQMGRSSILSSYINYLIQQIYELKQEQDYFNTQEIYVVLDELGVITEKGVNKPVIDLIRLGRSEGIGVLWADQSYINIKSRANGLITKSTDYIFCMNFQDSQEISKICNDYNADSTIKDDIRNLSRRNQIECYIFHRPPLITYDLDNGEREEVLSEPIKISLLPPLSGHEKPGEG